MSEEPDLDIVHFDVGGRLFKTSRSLITDRYEDSVLATLVSNASQETQTHPIFIDRNGDTFALVLDYLRYGRITLPITVSRAMFLRDLDFYGVLHNDQSVTSGAEVWANQVVVNQVTKLQQDLRSLNGLFQRTETTMNSLAQARYYREKLERCH